MFVNLLGNALGHNPPGTKVVITAMPDGPGAVAVRVADDGDGLPPELARAVTEAAGQRDPRWMTSCAAGTNRPRQRGGRAPALGCPSPAASSPRTAAVSTRAAERGTASW